MIRTFRAELARLVQRRMLVGTGLVVLAAGVGGPAAVLAGAPPASRAVPDGSVPTLADLAEAGGGTELFRTVAAFAGTFVFVVFVGMFALEFARGTYRTMLLRQPRRIRLLAGKLGALLAFAAVTLAGIEVVTWVAALFEAPSAGVSTAAWTSVDAVGAALADYGIALAWVTGYAVLGMTVAVLLRSVPLALGVGIAWAGPFEHIVSNAWTPAGRVFPGLLLEAVGRGGTTEVGLTRAMLTAAAYVAVAAAVSGAVFARRDVTG